MNKSLEASLLGVAAMASIAATCLVVASCGKEPPKQVTVGSKAELIVAERNHYQVTRLFEQDNATVYRFYDQGEYHYFVDARTSVIGTDKDTHVEVTTSVDADGNVSADAETVTTKRQDEVPTLTK